MIVHTSSPPTNPLETLTFGAPLAFVPINGNATRASCTSEALAPKAIARVSAYRYWIVKNPTPRPAPLTVTFWTSLVKPSTPFVKVVADTSGPGDVVSSVLRSSSLVAMTPIVSLPPPPSTIVIPVRVLRNSSIDVCRFCGRDSRMASPPTVNESSPLPSRTSTVSNPRTRRGLL
jgi:hypothetical protein